MYDLNLLIPKSNKEIITLWRDWYHEFHEIKIFHSIIINMFIIKNHNLDLFDCYYIVIYIALHLNFNHKQIKTINYIYHLYSNIV